MLYIKKKKNYHAKFGTFLLQNERQRKRVAPLLVQAFLISFYFFNLGFPLGAPITYQFKKKKKKKSMRDLLFCKKDLLKVPD